MTPTDYNFEEVLGLFEANDWQFYKILGCYRVFTKEGEYPCVIEYVEEIKCLFREKQEKNKSSN